MKTDELIQSLPSIVEEARLQNGQEVADVCAKAGFNHKYSYNRIRAGKVGNIGVKTLTRLLEAVGYTLSLNIKKNANNKAATAEKEGICQ